MDFVRRVLVTGGAGFIGCHLVRYLVNRYAGYLVVNLDLLEWSGHILNIKDILGRPNHIFVRGDITDEVIVEELFREYRFDTVINVAAQSHVDRSIMAPRAFAWVNVVGTVTLLSVALRHWQKTGFEGKLFYQISTDEVFGSLGREGTFTEQSPYTPRSPYAASKAGADHFVRAFAHTYGMPVVISCCTNNYGPYQYPEKLIPLVIRNILRGEPIPVYGKGENVRDWLWVGDHIRAIDLIMHRGKPGTTYLISAGNELKNIEVVERICDIMDEMLGRPLGTSRKLITFVVDRPGHDFRYSLDSSLTRKELGWEPAMPFEEGLRITVKWYVENQEWIDGVISSAYESYYFEWYSKRLQKIQAI